MTAALQEPRYRTKNPIPYIVTTYNATPEARPTGNGRAEPQGILLIKDFSLPNGNQIKFPQPIQILRYAKSLLH